MDHVKNDDYYVQKIKQDLEFITKHMKNVGIEELNANEVLLDSMLFRMIQISENARKLSDGFIGIAYIRHRPTPSLSVCSQPAG